MPRLIERCPSASEAQRPLAQELSTRVERHDVLAPRSTARRTDGSRRAFLSPPSRSPRREDQSRTAARDGVDYEGYDAFLSSCVARRTAASRGLEAIKRIRRGLALEYPLGAVNRSRVAAPSAPATLADIDTVTHSSRRDRPLGIPQRWKPPATTFSVSIGLQPYVDAPGVSLGRRDNPLSAPAARRSTEPSPAATARPRVSPRPCVPTDSPSPSWTRRDLRLLAASAACIRRLARPTDHRSGASGGPLRGLRFARVDDQLLKRHPRECALFLWRPASTLTAFQVWLGSAAIAAARADGARFLVSGDGPRLQRRLYSVMATQCYERSAGPRCPLCSCGDNNGQPRRSQS